MFGVITSEKRWARLLRRWIVPRLAPIGATLVPRFVASSRIFEYLSQTRIHYWMSDRAKQDAHGRRGRVVGRRLPWNGDNFESLRTMNWQVHLYGQIPSGTAEQLEKVLGVPVSVFTAIRNRRLRPGSPSRPTGRIRRGERAARVGGRTAWRSHSRWVQRYFVTSSCESRFSAPGTSL
jgi:hypothetical protein